MTTLFLDGRAYATPHAYHLALKRLLHLPDYYGCTADALYDCLAGRSTPVNVWVYHPGEGETAIALRRTLRVFEDLDGQVRCL